MKKLASLLVVGTVFSTFLFSCHKNDLATGGVTAPTTTTDSFFAALALQPKTVTIDAVAGGSVYGNSGTRYVFSPNAFQTAAGASVTGQVQLQLCEYLQKGDMIFSKMLPISNNEPLLSAGEINVIATQNGQPVYLKYGSPFKALVPQTTTAPASLQFFSGDLNADTTNSRVNWVQPVIDSNKHSYDGVSVVVGGDTVSIISDSVALCNADAFMISPNYQTFSVTVVVNGLTLPQASTLYAYAAYDNYKAVWPLGVIGSYTYGIYTESHVPNIPVHFVVFTTINGLFYGGTLAATPTNSNNYTVTLNQVDPATFKAQLNAL